MCAECQGWHYRHQVEMVYLHPGGDTWYESRKFKVGSDPLL